MKKRLGTSLSILLLISPLAHAGTQFQETAAIGIGTGLALYGLKLLHKSTKKRGTASQGLIGFAATFGGGYIATHGPKYIRSQNMHWFKRHVQKIPYVGEVINPHSYPENKAKAQIKYAALAGEKHISPLKKIVYSVYLALLEYDIFDMWPVEDPPV